jgi:hypothetical protein
VVDVGLNPDFAPTIENGKLVDRGHARYQKTTLDDLEINAAVNGGMASDYWGQVREWVQVANANYKTIHNDYNGYSSWPIDDNYSLVFYPKHFYRLVPGPIYYPYPFSACDSDISYAGGGTVILKATDANGNLLAFNFGGGPGVTINRPGVILTGETGSIISGGIWAISVMASDVNVGNMIIRNSRSGIRLQPESENADISGCKIVGNTIEDSFYYGISLFNFDEYSFPSENLISSNTIRRVRLVGSPSSSAGIHVYGSWNNVVTSNIIEDCEYGIVLDGWAHWDCWDESKPPILIYDYRCKMNQVISNLIQNCGHAVLLGDEVDENLICQNVIRQCLAGIALGWGINTDPESLLQRTKLNVITSNDLTQSGLPGWDKGVGCIYLDNKTESNLIYEVGYFPAATNAKRQVNDNGLANRIVGVRADEVTHNNVSPGIGKKFTKVITD